MMSSPFVKTLRVRPHLALAAFGVLVAGCGDSGTGPSNGAPSIRIVAGGGITDSVLAQPVQALVAEVRDAHGKVIPKVLVRFQSRPPSDPDRQYEGAIFVCPLTAPVCSGSLFVTDSTDQSGRAKAIIRLGTVVGKATVVVTVPELGVQDSATFTVTAGAPAQLILTPRDTTLAIGGTATLDAHATDKYGNPRPEAATFTAGAGNAITLDAPTKTVTAREMGMQWVYARVGTYLDSVVVRVLPGGRLLVWSPALAVVRLVNIDGKNERTLVTNIGSNFGAFPSFGPTRQSITLHSATASSNVGPSTDAIVLDTTGAPRRDISVFESIIAERQTNDGNVMVVGRRSGDPDGYHVFRVATDNTITLLASLNGLGGTYGGADIAYSGDKVAYLAGTVLKVLNLSTNTTTTLDQSARSPRWSVQGDRLVFLFPSICGSDLDGIATIINADGSGRKVVANQCYSPGLAWSPDGAYIIGRSSQDFGDIGLRIVRLSDGANVVAHFQADYFQPDWR